MYIVLTDQGIFLIRLEDLKFFSSVKGWFCEAKNYVYNYILDNDQVYLSNSICRTFQDFQCHLDDISVLKNLQEGGNCKLENCYCGFDIGIPKGVTSQYVHKLKKMCLDYPTDKFNELNYYDLDRGENILAFGRLDFLLKKFVHVDWFLGKRCNYDCTYCSPSIHDNHSPIKTYDYYKKALEYLLVQIEGNNSLCEGMFLNFSLHGGEPTLIPKVDELVRDIYNNRLAPAKIEMMTNFSQPNELILDLNKYADITYSVHLDYFDDSSLDKLKEYINLHKHSHKHFRVKVMYQRKYKPLIYSIVKELELDSNKSLIINPLLSKKSKKLHMYDQSDIEFIREINHSQ